MSDDLVKRLKGWLIDIQTRSTGVWAMDQDLKAGIYRIQELEKACKEWSEVSQSNYQRAKAAEAKLAMVEKERDEWQSLAESAIKDDAAKNIHYAEIQTKLAEMLEVGNVMAASIEGNYYIAGIAKKWREAININGEQP